MEKIETKQKQQFTKYNSIPNKHDVRLEADRKQWIQDMKSLHSDLDEETLEKQWVCSEKVHGSNMSFLITNDKQIQPCRRNGLLKLTDNFYNFQVVFAEIQVYLLKIHELLAEKYDNLLAVQVFGELFGGYYQNDKGAYYSEKNCLKVQKEVLYTPKNDFSAFDIQITLNDGKEPFYIDYQEQVDIFEKSGIQYVKPLKYGSYQELLQFDVETFESEIYKIYGLNKTKDNISEGIVIRPLKGHFLVKKKSIKFCEKKDTVPSKQVFSSSDEQNHTSKVLEYICKSRIQTVASKCTQEELSSKQMHKFYRLVADDAIKDFLLENPSNDSSVAYYYANKKKVTSLLIKETVNIIRTEDVF